MLGHGRFNFETPNVIDLGDAPPSRPSRLQKDAAGQAAAGGPSPSASFAVDPGSADKVYKPPLSRTVKLDYTLDADDEPNAVSMDEDDPEFSGARPTSPSPPATGTTPAASTSPQSLEQTRLFAATILSESERRESRRNLMAGRLSRGSSVGRLIGMRLSSRSYEVAPLRKAVGMDDEYLLKIRQEQRKRCFNRLLMMGALGLLLLVFIVSARRAMGGRVGYDDISSTKTSTAVDFLVENGISSRGNFGSVSTPQYQAAYWIANTDPENLAIPSALDESSSQFVQRYVLALLYFAWNGSDWINSFNFIAGEHECGWFERVPDENGEMFAVGVTCDENLKVRNLLIPSNNLQGQIPEEIEHLTLLDFISLKHNELSGSIPTSIAKLTLLDYLDLKFNNLSGSIPSFIGDLDRLEVLGLSKNRFEGVVPESIGSLRLKTLAIDDNMLTGSIDHLKNMGSLEFFYAEDNELSGDLDQGLLSALGNLMELDLSGNRLQGSQLPTEVLAFPNLRVLDLSHNQISGTIPETLGENTKLEYLSLRANLFKSNIPAGISSLKALTHLDLEGNVFTGELPASSLASLERLSYLFLGKNPLNSAVLPEEFQALTSLRELSMDDMALWGEFPNWVGGLTDLKLLDLRNNELVGAVTADLSQLKELTFLLLSDNKLTGDVPESLGSLTDLAVVSLHHNGFVDNVDDMFCLSNSVDVEVLATDCGEITCTCCNDCCSGDSCYEGVVWDALENNQGSWEEHFRRADYSFNPHILFGDEEDGK